MVRARNLYRWMAMTALGLALPAGAGDWVGAGELARPRCCVPSSKSDCTHDATILPGAASPAAPEGTAPEGITPGDEQPDFSQALSQDFGAASGPETAAPNMLGDFLGSSYSNVTIVDSLGAVRVLPNTMNPFARGFKIAENQSARPQDRVFFDYNYFQISQVNIQRMSTGFEKRVFGGQSSFGVRVPYYLSSPDAVVGAAGVGAFGLSPNVESAAGDLTTFFKWAPLMDDITGDTLTLGMAVTAPTGSDTIAGVTPLYTTTIRHHGSIQPFAGFLIPGGSGWFAQGFTSVDTPFSSGDTTWWFNDVSVGKYINRGPAYYVTAVIPLMELHVNTPVSGDTISVTGVTPASSAVFGRGGNALPASRAVGTFKVANQTNLNTAITFELNRRSTLAIGVVTPLEGPRPYNGEFQVQFNRYGIGSGPRYRQW